MYLVPVTHKTRTRGMNYKWYGITDCNSEFKLEDELHRKRSLSTYLWRLSDHRGAQTSSRLAAPGVLLLFEGQVLCNRIPPERWAVVKPREIILCCGDCVTFILRTISTSAPVTKLNPLFLSRTARYSVMSLPAKSLRRTA